MNTCQVSVIIPTKNEAANINLVLTSIMEQLRHITFEIICIDDSSTDATRDIIRQLAKEHAAIKLISRKLTPDLGSSILLGIHAANGTLIVGMDGDGNHDPSYLPELIEKSRAKTIVIGSRFLIGGGMERIWRYWLSYFFNFSLRKILCLPITDATSGYYCIQRKDLLALDPKSIYYGYGEYCIRLIIAAQNQRYSFVELPVYYPKRIGGNSKSRLLRMAITYTWQALRIKMKH
jgi:dolichol-phosphate mannosyltransferase